MKRLRLVLDRLELPDASNPAADGIAVFDTGDDGMLELPASALPAGAREGDCFTAAFREIKADAENRGTTSANAEDASGEETRGEYSADGENIPVAPNGDNNGDCVIENTCENGAPADENLHSYGENAIVTRFGALVSIEPDAAERGVRATDAENRLKALFDRRNKRQK